MVFKIAKFEFMVTVHYPMDKLRPVVTPIASGCYRPKISNYITGASQQPKMTTSVMLSIQDLIIGCYQ